MYRYVLGYTGIVDSWYWDLLHEKQYSKADLDTLVKIASKAVIAKDWVGYDVDFRDIGYDVIEWLVKHKGFCQPKAEAVWYWPQDYILEDEEGDET